VVENGNVKYQRIGTRSGPTKDAVQNKEVCGWLCQGGRTDNVKAEGGRRLLVRLLSKQNLDVVGDFVPAM